MVGLVLFLAFGFALLWVLAVAAVVRGLRHPPRKTFAWAVSRNLPTSPDDISGLASKPYWTEWEFSTHSCSSKVWDITGQSTTGPTVVLTPGWSDSRWAGLCRVPTLLPLCSRILMWDPPGLGQTRGSCTLGAVDSKYLVALVGQACEKDARIVLFGWSMGAGISIAGAADIAQANTHTIVGVIAEAPYILPKTPATNVLRSKDLPARPLVAGAIPLAGILGGVGPRWKGFNRLEHASELKCPMLVVHGTDDEICPLADGKALGEAAPNGTIKIISGAKHMNLWTDENHTHLTAQAVTQFLSYIGDIAQ